MTYAPERFGDLYLDWAYYNTGADTGVYKMPIKAGDTFTFQLTVFPATEQVIKVPTKSSLKERTYMMVELVIIE